MNILQFTEHFPTEDSCKEHFRAQREHEGIKCKRCAGHHHYWLKAKWQWQCSGCGFRTTLKSGSIMEGSKVSVRTWYLAMAFMSFSKKGISAAELQRQLDHPIGGSGHGRVFKTVQVLQDEGDQRPQGRYRDRTGEGEF